MTLRETYARDICQNPGVPLEDCPRRDEHYALVDERLAGLVPQLAEAIENHSHDGAPSERVISCDRGHVAGCSAAIVAALEERT